MQNEAAQLEKMFEQRDDYFAKANEIDKEITELVKARIEQQPSLNELEELLAVVKQHSPEAPVDANTNKNIEWRV